jgi:hypothetical protein
MMTPRGRNHAWKLYDLARSRPDWFAELLTVEETKAIGPDIIADERASGMSEDMMAQEYYFDAALPGAYYGKLLQIADTDKRIGRAPWAPDATVHTAWDLGIGDSTAGKSHAGARSTEGSGLIVSGRQGMHAHRTSRSARASRCGEVPQRLPHRAVQLVGDFFEIGGAGVVGWGEDDGVA